MQFYNNISYTLEEKQCFTETFLPEWNLISYHILITISPLIFGTVSKVSKIVRLFISYTYAFSCKMTMSLHKRETKWDKIVHNDQRCMLI
jgi:hypothetical protein